MPLQRRLPKIGFNNIFGVHYAPVNVADLNIFDAGSVIDEAELRQQRIVRGRWDGVKILGEGELTRALTVKVHAISGAAREKIEKAGGTVDLIPRPNKGPRASE
jgi:large subunit ribosomal protein L15